MSNNYTYINQYNKEHYKQFKVALKEDDYNVIQKYIEENKLSKAEFVRLAIEKILIEKR